MVASGMAARGEAVEESRGALANGAMGEVPASHALGPLSLSPGKRKVTAQCGAGHRWPTRSGTQRCAHVFSPADRPPSPLDGAIGHPATAR